MNSEIFEVNGRARDLRDLYLASVKRRDDLARKLMEAESDMAADGRALTAYLVSIDELEPTGGGKP